MACRFLCHQVWLRIWILQRDYSIQMRSGPFLAVTRIAKRRKSQKDEGAHQQPFSLQQLPAEGGWGRFVISTYKLSPYRQRRLSTAMRIQFDPDPFRCLSLRCLSLKGTGINSVAKARSFSSGWRDSIAYTHRSKFPATPITP